MAGIVFSKSSGLNDSVYGKCEAPIRAFLEERVPYVVDFILGCLASAFF